MWKKRENWVFVFGAIGAIAALTKILEYFGIKPSSGGASSAPIAIGGHSALWWSVAFIVSSLALSILGLYWSNKRSSALQTDRDHWMRAANDREGRLNVTKEELEKCQSAKKQLEDTVSVLESKDDIRNTMLNALKEASGREDLKFLTWHSSGSRNLPSRVNIGTPTWVAVKNELIDIPKTAKNVTASLTFMHASGEFRYYIPEASWYWDHQIKGGTRSTSWDQNIELDGGEEQSFVFFETNDERQIWLFKNGFPMARLEDGRWEVTVKISSDNVNGFEGKIGFTLTRNSLVPDQPAFTRLRTVEPNLPPKEQSSFHSLVDAQRGAKLST